MKADPIRQDTAPPLMMYGRDRAKLEALDWDAHGLFWSALMWLVDGGHDYRMLVPKHKLAIAAGRRASLKVLQRAAQQLVDEGIWKDAGDAWEVVLHHQLDIERWRNPTLRARDLRDKRLHRDSDLLQRIKDRDRLLCRYCGVRTRWDGDQRSRIAGTYDHVDPDGDNTFENVVIACRHCNCTVKKDRTLEQAGMSLYRPGTTAEEISAGRARPVVAASAASASVPERKARSDPGDPSPPPDHGRNRIQIGSGSDPDPGPVPPARVRDSGPNRIGSGSEQPAAGGRVSRVSVEPVAPPPWTDADLDRVDHSLVEGNPLG